MPLEALVEPRDSAHDWISVVEASMEGACDTLSHPSLERMAKCQSQLEAVAARLEEVCETAAGSGQSIPAEFGPRLWMLRKQTRMAKAMIRQAAAFYRGLEQSDPNAVLGYSPAGLERAL
jgi:hypothetical protein